MVRFSCQCVVPPYVLEKLAGSSNPAVRRAAVEALQIAAAVRAGRLVRAGAPRMNARRARAEGLERNIYDMRSRPVYYLPGTLVRSEGQPASADAAVNEAYDYSGNVYNFYKELFGRNSLDNRGMALDSSIHTGDRFNNAFWNGEQMAYGDGDGVIFQGFTKSLDVVAHELTHGVVTHTANLEYQNESGAMNEHFADVFGVLVKQHTLGHDVQAADWLIGREVMVPRPTVRALRSFDEKVAYSNDEYLGDDPQPKHMRDKYTGTEDYGGVHINSGIPNHAFYRFAKALGGNAWEKPGQIWYRALLSLQPLSEFSDLVRETLDAAAVIHGEGSPEIGALADAWDAVGLQQCVASARARRR